MSGKMSNLDGLGDNPTVVSTKTNLALLPGDQGTGKNPKDNQVVQPTDVPEGKRGQKFPTNVGVIANEINTTNMFISNSSKSQKRSGSSSFQSPFNVKEPIKTFIGRDDELQQMHGTFQKNQHKSNQRVLSHAQAIVGMGGVGKTEMVLKYVKNYSNFYTHILWINAATYDEAECCFLEVASRIGVSANDRRGRPRQLDFLTEEIYDYFCTERCLIVFDDANPRKNLEEDGVRPFLPKIIKPSWKAPTILITSRKNKWGEIPVIKLEHWNPLDHSSTASGSNQAMFQLSGLSYSILKALTGGVYIGFQCMCQLYPFRTLFFGEIFHETGSSEYFKFKFILIVTIVAFAYALNRTFRFFFQQHTIKKSVGFFRRFLNALVTLPSKIEKTLLSAIVHLVIYKILQSIRFYLPPMDLENGGLRSYLWGHFSIVILVVLILDTGFGEHLVSLAVLYLFRILHGFYDEEALGGHEASEIFAEANILFLCGTALINGLERTFRFFFQEIPTQASICFCAGIITVQLGYPILGLIVEISVFLASMTSAPDE